jgi:DNA-binding response OmpR family regulator
MRLLVVEDELDLAEAVARAFRRDGYAVDLADDGAQALELAQTTPYDLLLLDLSLPGLDGLTLCQQLRRDQPTTLVLMLTARGALADRVAGLDSGADDYVTKPFALAEVQARVRALLRRERRLSGTILAVQDLRLDPAAHRAWQGDRPLKLTTRELALLEYLLRHAGRAVSHEELLEHVWDANADPFTNTVRVHVLALRRKLGDSAESPRYIETVVGRGYRLLADPRADAPV